MLTGARREEIGALRWSEIDGDTIRLAGDRTKNGDPHTIPLSTAAEAVLDAVPKVKGSPFVFTITGETSVSGWSRAKGLLDGRMAELAKKEADDGEPVTFEPWRLHDLRRTMATALQRLGFNLQVIEATLGPRAEAGNSL